MASLAYGVLLGGIVQLILQLPFLSRYGLSFVPSFQFNHPALKRLLVLMGPAVLGAAVYQVNVMVSTILASMLAEGSVSYLYYADRLLQFPLGIFAIALGTAALPSFSTLAARKDIGGLQEALSASLRLVNFITLPATLGLMVISVPVFALLFQRGAFDPRTTALAAQALVCFAFGLWGISGTKIVVPAFYALQDTRTPVWIGLLTFVLNFLFSLILMGPVVAGANAGTFASGIAAVSQALGTFSLSHAGLALANSISSTCQFLILLLILQGRVGGFKWREFGQSFLLSLFNALIMALPLYWLVQRIDWLGSEVALITQGAIFATVLTTGLIIYILLSYITRSPERRVIAQVAAAIRRRVSG